MKKIVTLMSLSMLTLSVVACGGTDTKETTVVHDRPVIQQTTDGMSPAQVESRCQHGYDNSSHSCY